MISVANQKGGVGKTTTSINLCACLASLGFRILLIDMDSQANATSGLGLDKTEGGSAYQAMLGNGPLAGKVRPTGLPGLDMIPSEWTGSAFMNGDPETL